MTDSYDPDRVCVKCGFDRTDDETVQRVYGALTRIRRLCLRCKYKWDELPLDHDQEREDKAMEKWRRGQAELYGMLTPPKPNPGSREERVAAAWEHIRSLIPKE